MKRIFSVVVCAVGIFFSTAAGSKDECLNSYVSADSLLIFFAFKCLKIFLFEKKAITLQRYIYIW